MDEIKNAGTSHSSAVTNIDAFDKMIKEASQKAGTAHSAAVTNIEAFNDLLQSVFHYICM